MEQKLYSINDIQTACRVRGSHFFDPSSMRFFKSRVLDEVYQGPGGIYFITSERYDTEPRKFTVRQFHPEDADITTVSEFNELSKYMAVKLAKEKAIGDPPLGFSKMVPPEEGGVPYDARGLKVTSEPAYEFTELDQFVADCRKHGNPETSEEVCRQLIQSTARHYKYMVNQCNGEWPYDRSHNSDDGHPTIVENLRRKIRRLAIGTGANGVLFSGDPRGVTVKLVWKNGETNDFGKEGWCIPTELKIALET